jgi:hypothetical protein
MRRLPLLLLASTLVAGAWAPPSGAQTLKLASLKLVHSDVVGPWVAYRVRTRSGRGAVRELKQRVAVVGKEKTDDGLGYWVELKTTDRAGTRIERGLFVAERSRSARDEEWHGENGLSEGEAPAAGESDAAPSPSEPLRLVRYQMLAPGGKLYEYPVASAFSPRAGGGVSTYELFEFDPSVKPVRRSLGPDTLRMGSRVIPAVLEWTSRAGTDDWPVFEDSTARYRILLTQTVWRNPAVPVTGFARSLFRVTTKRLPVFADSVRLVIIPPDTSLVFAPADTTIGPTSLKPSDGALLSWTEVVLEGLGADAVAEVTQTPEPAPASDTGTIVR